MSYERTAVKFTRKNAITELLYTSRYNKKRKKNVVGKIIKSYQKKRTIEG